MRKLNALFTSVSLTISFTLLLNGLVVTPVYAQQRVIVVNADQPNVWTLEQAHYLLAQMHRRNLNLKARAWKAFLTLTNPNQTEVVTLSDPVTNISVTTLVARRPPE